MKRLSFLIFITILLPCHADEPVPPSLPVVVKPQKESTPTSVLEGLLIQIKSLERQVGEVQDEEEKAELHTTLDNLQNEFDELLAGKESVAYFDSNIEEASIQEELLDIFDPLIGEVKNATSGSREKDALRNSIALLTQRKIAILSALERIDSTAGADMNASAELKSYLSGKRLIWDNRLQQTDLQLKSAQLQLKEKEVTTQNVVRTASEVIAKFFRTRGFHLLLALGLSALITVLISLSYKQFKKVSPIHRKEELYSLSKTIDGAVYIGSGVLTFCTIIITFFLCDDWVLLSASLLLLIGIFWALRNNFAEIAEELRILLNIGSVREGERLNFEGLSWRVEKIWAYSKLVNPELEGGLVRIPLKALVGLHSRPCKASEKYFPTALNDWVLLSDGLYGKVLHQTPEYVELVQLGGSRKTYTTPDFLAQSPTNLSTAGFRISTTFGIDYKHQSTVTTDILETFKADMIKGMKDQMPNPEFLKKLNLEFSSAAASSLDFVILTDFTSEAAPKYNVLTRLIQKLAVETCNTHSWEIPFTQVTIHQAEGSNDV